MRASERECVRVYDFRKLLTAAILVEEMAETDIYIYTYIYIQRRREREKERQTDRQTAREREKQQ